MKIFKRLELRIGRLLATAFIAVSLSAYAKSEDEYRPMPIPQNEFSIGGTLIPAMSVAIAEMKRYPPLSALGRQIESYDVWVIHDVTKDTASFTFVPREGADGLSLKSKGAVVARIDVRIRDLKIISKRIFN